MTDRARVLHVHSGNLFGGVETMLLTIAAHQQATPNTEHIFALCFQGQLSELLAQLGPLPPDLGPARASRPWTVLRARKRLRSVITEQDPAIVICHAPWAQAVLGPAVRDTGRTSVYWQHGITKRDTWVERWARYTRPDLVIANSKFTARSVPNIYSGVSCDVILCPVENQSTTVRARDEVRREVGTNPNSTVIIQVSRMEPWKGHRLHLEALAGLRDLDDWECWIVGGAQRPEETRFMDEMQSLANSAGITDSVRFLGQRSDVPDLLAAADIFCQPNLGPEPFGIVFIEALYAGLPLVTTAMGGPLEIVDDSCGVLTPPGDARGLATELRGLICDRERRLRLAKHAPDRGHELCDPPKQMRALETTLLAVHRGRSQ